MPEPRNRQHRPKRQWWRGGDLLEGPLEDSRAVLAETPPADHSLLQESERLDETEPSTADLEQAAAAEAEVAAEQTAEAEAMVTRDRHRRVPNSLTPEGLEDALEPAPPPAEESLHETNPTTPA